MKVDPPLVTTPDSGMVEMALELPPAATPVPLVVAVVVTIPVAEVTVVVATSDDAPLEAPDGALVASVPVAVAVAEFPAVVPEPTATPRPGK